MNLIPDETLFYQAFVFIALAIFLSKVLFAPMLKVFEAREAAHKGREAEARRLADEAGRAREEFEKIFRSAQADGEAVRAELLKDAAERQREVLAAARHKAEETIGAARTQLEASRRELAIALPQQADQLALRLAERLLGR